MASGKVLGGVEKEENVGHSNFLLEQPAEIKRQILILGQGLNFIAIIGKVVLL